jgi:VRR-NUC domain
MKLSDIDNPRVRAEIAKQLAPAPVASSGGTEESGIHDDIADYCKSRGWLAFHGSMAHRARRTLGEPDFVIARHDGVTLYVEVKTKTGKLSPEQQAIGHALTALGQRWAVVRSLEEFVAFANK